MDYSLRNKLIDSRNEELWNYLANKFDISVNVIDSDDSQIIRDGNKVSLRLISSNVDVSIFTHELLHLWLWENDCDFVNSLSSFIQIIDNDRVSLLFEGDFDYTFANLIDHILMFDKYMEMGCDIDKFLPDKNVITSYRSKIITFATMYNKLSVRHDRAFIIYLLSICEHQCGKNQYFDLLTALRVANNELFDIIEKFVNNVKGISSSQLSYDSCVLFLLYDLDEYYSFFL
ncbi:hypothetical protein [Bacteroides faecis]|uniref:hypothetical protein n=1 Tax=Bacteroides faecis TaxID=674529 RepID=UPI0039C4BF58